MIVVAARTTKSDPRAFCLALAAEAEGMLPGS